MKNRAHLSHAFELPGGKTGVLLIHGLTGAPAEMRLVARGLNRAGYTVHCMQLAGHCGTADDLMATSWLDWRDSVDAAAMRLSTQTEKFFVGGLSMGAILALDYASRHTDRVAGVLAYAPVFEHDGWAMPWYSRLGPLLLPILKRFNLWRDAVAMELPPYGIKDVSIRNRVVRNMLAGRSAESGLAGTPYHSLVDMYALVRDVRANLHEISCPCLVVHSDEDDFASDNNALLIWHRVLRAPVSIVWLSDSYHMVTVDRERRKVVNASMEFIDDTCRNTDRMLSVDASERVSPVLHRSDMLQLGLKAWFNAVSKTLVQRFWRA